FDVRSTLGSPVNPVWIKHNIACGVDTFLVGLEVLVDWTATWAAQRCVGYKLQVRFGPDCDHRQSRRESHAAFCLNVLDHRFSFETVQILIKEQLDARLLVAFCKPLCCLGVEKFLPDELIPSQEA